MACGKAIVSTPVGCQGLGLVDGRELLVRTGSTDFAAALCDVLADPVRATSLGREARQTAVARFSWDAIAERAMDSYLKLARPRQ
jgi:glycosyltransferase involved in cell wall biosynthesis